MQHQSKMGILQLIALICILAVTWTSGSGLNDPDQQVDYQINATTLWDFETRNSDEKDGGISAVIGAIASAIAAGSSIASVAGSFGSMDYNVKFKMEIENYSDQYLFTHQWKIHTGQVAKPHVPVKPGVKEGMSGHKTGNSATGCVGTVSWRIGHTNKMIVVMYSVPYSHDWYSNWLGVGIFDFGDTSNHYNIMYYGTEKFFKRKEFYYDVDPVVYQDTNYFIFASMGTTHKPEIQVQLFPMTVEHLADSLKGEKKE